MSDYNPRRVVLTGSQRNSVATTETDASVSMGVVTVEGEQLELTWPSLDDAERFRVNIEALIVSAHQQVASAARQQGPMFVIPVPLRNVQVQPDLLGQKLGIAVDSGTSYQTVWSLDLENVPQLIDALQSALDRAAATSIGKA